MAVINENGNPGTLETGTYASEEPADWFALQGESDREGTESKAPG